MKNAIPAPLPVPVPAIHLLNAAGSIHHQLERAIALAENGEEMFAHNFVLPDPEDRARFERLNHQVSAVREKLQQIDADMAELVEHLRAAADREEELASLSPADLAPDSGFGVGPDAETVGGRKRRLSAAIAVVSATTNVAATAAERPE